MCSLIEHAACSLSACLTHTHTGVTDESCSDRDKRCQLVAEKRRQAGYTAGWIVSSASSFPVFLSIPCSPIMLITTEKWRGQPVEHAEVPHTQEPTVHTHKRSHHWTGAKYKDWGGMLKCVRVCEEGNILVCFSATVTHSYSFMSLHFLTKMWMNVMQTASCTEIAKVKVTCKYELKYQQPLQYVISVKMCVAAVRLCIVTLWESSELPTVLCGFPRCTNSNLSSALFCEPTSECGILIMSWTEYSPWTMI